MMLALLTVPALTACSRVTNRRVVTVASLESASPVEVDDRVRAVIRDVERLRPLCVALGPRLGLVEVRSPADWEVLQQVVPGLGPCPDLSTGMVVGVVSWAGMPVNGGWPIRMESVRVRFGGGLVNAHFEPGSYLPDGSGYLETAYVEGLQTVLLVDVDGTAFYPEDSHLRGATASRQ
jgi:hypothetical protein